MKEIGYLLDQSHMCRMVNSFLYNNLTAAQILRTEQMSLCLRLIRCKLTCQFADCGRNYRKLTSEEVKLAAGR